MLIERHEKKITNLTYDLTTYDLTTEELDIFKQGFQHSIPPNHLNKTDIFASFELIHRFLEEDLNNNEEAGHMKSALSYLATSYYNYYPTKETIKNMAGPYPGGF